MERPILIKDLGRMKPTPQSNYTAHFGLFQCPFCPNTFQVIITCVNQGHTKSCGCYRVKCTKERGTKHGLRHTRIYNEYCGMKGRCYGKNYKVTRTYKEKGIIVCDEWLNDIFSFVNWSMANGYRDDLTLNRIDNKGNYCPENCEWVNWTVQGQNTDLLRSTNTSGFRGVSWDKGRKKWIAKITNNLVVTTIGAFTDKMDAVKAYNNWVIENKTRHPINPIN